MKISQDVRDYAAEQGVSEQEALTKGMQEKAIEFVKKALRFTKKFNLNLNRKQNKKPAVKLAFY